MPFPPRFHAPEVRDPGQEIVLRGEEHHHLHRVLRLRAGDPVSLFDGQGRGFTGRILATTAKESILRTETAEAPSREPALELELAPALAKGGKFELVLQKGTELGAAAFHPLYTERTDVRPVADRDASRLDRWRRVVLEACKQSGRCRLPGVSPARTLREFLLSDCPPGALRLLLDPEAGPDSAWPDPPASTPRVILAIGPEGGWTGEEKRAMGERGFLSVGLGPRVLRAETASIVATAVAQLRYGDLASPASRPPREPRR